MTSHVSTMFAWVTTLLPCDNALIAETRSPVIILGSNPRSTSMNDLGAMSGYGAIERARTLICD
jgi:hypothetical protein